MITLMKTLSWALVSGLVIGATVLYETGSLQIAVISASISAALKTPVYTLHEWAWNKMTGHHKVHLPEGTEDEEEELKLAA